MRLLRVSFLTPRSSSFHAAPPLPSPPPAPSPVAVPRRQRASELLRTIRTKEKQFSVDAAADAYLPRRSLPPPRDSSTPPSVQATGVLPSPAREVTPRVPSLARGPTFAPSPAPSPTFANLSSGTLLPSCCLRRPSARGPPLFSVQQVARSFKTCRRRSFVRFKKPKHRQSSALRRQERHLRREQVRASGAGWGGGGSSGSSSLTGEKGVDAAACLCR